MADHVLLKDCQGRQRTKTQDKARTQHAQPGTKIESVGAKDGFRRNADCDQQSSKEPLVMPPELSPIAQMGLARKLSPWRRPSPVLSWIVGRRLAQVPRRGTDSRTPYFARSRFRETKKIEKGAPPPS